MEDELRNESSFLALANTRGLLPNTTNLLNDRRILYTPIVCFTETQTTNYSGLSELETCLPIHKVFRNDNDDKHKSLIILYNKCCFKCEEIDYYDVVTYAHFSSMISSLNFKLLLAYRNNGWNMQEFLRVITYLVR